MISVAIGQSGETLLLSEAVLEHFNACRQTRFWHREAGGLLFARISGNMITIEEATGPRPTDRRSRCSYQGDRRAEQQEIDQRHPLGLHYIGDWHTHPEPKPRPSGADDRAMISRISSSKHQLQSFLYVIVGTAAFPDGLALAVHDGRTRLDLMLDSVAASATS
ncbi:Mov34/MPN/PAD-1 family protein [Sphingomonas sp. AOB5]|uniref:Mov34/MPN/PAD-1 family protein n=1 Tax=Sphingomonas sp. AOB5 TaxID=3034017 RepID=UPI0023F8AFFE|nr:Mov34/MPN/PAD-1 family protein [Sphingomonas sp. AOB5]MDF7774274.1 Mov34/MPN/PAD-1 family protein [Sphingomonas sp. AOB5]